jgi:hypothetical protein
MTDWLSYAVGIGAVGVATLAIILAWRWRRDDRSLLQETKVLVEALAPAVEGIEAQVQKLQLYLKSTSRTLSSMPVARSGFQTAANTRMPVVPTPTRAAVSARQIRLQQAQALKEQRFRWQQTKDLARAIGWVLDRLNDEE